MAALSVCVVLTAGGPTNATASVTRATRTSFTNVTGVGPARRAPNNLLKVRLSSGQAVETHGGDQISEIGNSSPLVKAAARHRRHRHHRSCARKRHPARCRRHRRHERRRNRQRRQLSRSPKCAPAGQQRFHALYMWPSGTSDRHGQVHGQIERTISQMDGLIHQAGEESSGGTVSVNFKFACGSGGKPLVSPVSSGTTNNSFASIINTLQSRGYDSANEKYLIFFDHPAPYCGMATVQADASLSPLNLNNTGPSYAVVWGQQCWNPYATAHETGHTMGAVQHTAPHATDYWHCYDRNDVMCYNDGSPNYVSTDQPCKQTQYDCRFNDYFDARPQGGYLASHWNIGSTDNAFLAIH